MRYEFTRPYGRSYFGSGGGYGRVGVCNCRTGGRRDNGFMAGPGWVEPIDPTQPAAFVALGGDAINGNRRWGERGTWDPTAQAWTVKPGRLDVEVQKYPNPGEQIDAWQVTAPASATREEVQAALDARPGLRLVIGAPACRPFADPVDWIATSRP